MERRWFVKLFAAASAGGLATLASARAVVVQGVVFQVQGFTCITCAVGLDTMLKDERGVTWSKSSYPEGIVDIKFDPHVTDSAKLKAFIAETGFLVVSERKA